MPKRLVIVESPAKARTISGYLGPDFVVESSVGHIRDLPDSAAEIPEKYKGESWARLGVDVEHEFEPLYVVDPDKKKTVAQLKKQLAGADELLLATDEDREGEAIAWHLLEVLQPKVPVRRMVFHEITRDAIEQALDETRDVDERLVDAQESRRILDRLYGYEVSPVLWKKIMRGLSAGRVQSVATRLVVQRERERMAFRAAAWWDMVATFDPDSFEARLVSLDGQRVATGRDFGPDGKLRGEARQLDEEAARGLADRLQGSSFQVARVERKPYVRRPQPAVHDLDAAAGGEPQASLLGADDDAACTAPVRERLHHVHAHRLDDAVGVGAHGRARAGDVALRRRLRSARAAPLRAEGQERAGGARGDPPLRRSLPHAAGRALGALPRRARALRADLDAHGRVADEGRAGADCLASDRGRLECRRGSRVRRLRHRHHVPRLPRRLRRRARRGPRRAGGRRGAPPAEPRRGRRGGAAASSSRRVTRRTRRRATPRRRSYARSRSSASAARRRTRRSSARSSTAATSSSAAQRSSLPSSPSPSWACSRSTSAGWSTTTSPRRWRTTSTGSRRATSSGCEWLDRFYFGDGTGGLHELVSDLGAIDAREINSLEIGDGIVLRVGRYGPYLERDGQRASVPEELVPDELTVEKAEELLAQPQRRPRARHRSRDRAADRRPHRPLRPVRHRSPPRGLEGEAAHRLALQDDVARHDRRSTTRSSLLELPRVVGVAEDGEEVVARNGRYGPYVQQGKESRSLESEEQLFTIDLPERARPSRAAPAAARAAGRRDEAAPRARRRPGRRQGDRRSRRAASARTSPTARRTRACARATIRRRSRSTAPSSCSRSAARRDPAKRRRPSPQGVLNSSPQTSPTGQRRKLTDRVDARNTLAARLVRATECESEGRHSEQGGNRRIYLLR